MGRETSGFGLPIGVAREFAFLAVECDQPALMSRIVSALLSARSSSSAGHSTRPPTHTAEGSLFVVYPAPKRRGRPRRGATRLVSRFLRAKTASCTFEVLKLGQKSHSF